MESRFRGIAAGPRAFIGDLNCRRRVEPFGVPAQQELYAKTLPKCRLESAMNSILAHCKMPYVIRVVKAHEV